jgi:hypothetical protein
MTELVFESPRTAACELLSKTGNLDRGVDRIWVRLPPIPPKMVGRCMEAYCECNLQTLELGVYPDMAPKAQLVVLGQVKICRVVYDHVPRNCDLETFYVGQCQRCKSVYWTQRQ